MLDHVSIPVSDIDKSARFYDAVLATANAGIGLRISFQAQDLSSVDAFHAAALAEGGQDAGNPAERPQYTQPFYGAFVLDLDGFKIEAVCRRSDSRNPLMRNG